MTQGVGKSFYIVANAYKVAHPNIKWPNYPKYQNGPLKLYFCSGFSLCVHAQFSSILYAKELLLYSTSWPLPVTLLRVYKEIYWH